MQMSLMLVFDESFDFDDFSEVAQTIIKTIHRVPHLHDYDYELGEIEFYLGRSSEGNIYNRFRGHSRNYEHAVIVGKGTLADVRRWERGGIRILTGLKERGSLCCANIHKGPAGGEGSGEQYIYLCWRFVEDEGIGTATMAEIREIAEETDEKTDLDYDEIYDGIEVVRRQSESEPVRWATGHNPND